MNIIFYVVFEVTTWWLIGDSNFHELLKILDEAANMIGKRVYDFDLAAAEVLLPPCFTDDEHRYLVFGRTLEWEWLEILVYISFQFTMVILMIKSRFKNIGIDNSG